MRSLPGDAATLARTRRPLPTSEYVDFLPVLRPQLPGADRLLPYLRRIDATRIYTNHGPLMLELQDRLADHLGMPADGVICASSGTAALVAAILATAGRAREDRPFAVVPAFTFVATAAAVEQCGYRPYLADVDPRTWMLDPAQLRDHPHLDHIGLVVPVAPFGRPVPQGPWEFFRAATGIPVVIDGAASFAGLSQAPKQFLGHIPTALSFHATKAFATGEGGAVVTADERLSARATRVLNFGFDASRDSGVPSTNGKMSEYHAAVGLAELDGWGDKLAAFAAVAQCFRKSLATIGLGDRFFGTPDIAPNYALFRCVDKGEAQCVEGSLREDYIDYRRWYGGGVHRQTYYAQLPQERLDVSDAIASCLLGVPVAPDLGVATIARIVEALAHGVRRSG
jgi:dTDP-4-amino-4,6-dideoxygalactose transaminase